MMNQNSEAVLEAEGVTKHFSGVVAVDGVNFEISAGETRGLIGPNGAGKTTLFNCITGTYQLTAGSLYLGGTEITNEEPHKIARRGLARSFQVSNLFEEFSAFENLRLGVQIGERNFDFRTPHARFDDINERAESILDWVGLARQRDTTASELSHGQKRQLELGLSLTTDPDILLLDEPTAGIPSEEVDDMTNLIQSIGEDYTILIVEHNMDVVMTLADNIMVLDQGKIIADGAPDAIRRDDRVQSAYLGTEEDLFGSLTGGDEK